MLALAVLLLARIRIDTLAEAAVLPLRQNDVARHPWLGGLLSPQAAALLAQQQLVDPIGLLLIVAALGCLLAYALVAAFIRNDRLRYRVQLALLWAIILLTVVASSAKLILLRQGSGPASYSHDGGVIQTEATIAYLLAGRNPYSEDYVDTPMAEWGINEFRTALYHYPYLPWTFLFSAPFKLLADATIGWYDQRFVYLLLFVLMLVLAPRLAHGAQNKLLLVMLLGLNPIMGSDIIYGQNDSFVLAWCVLSLWLYVRGQSSLPRDAAPQSHGEAARPAAASPLAEQGATTEGRRGLPRDAAPQSHGEAARPAAASPLVGQSAVNGRGWQWASAVALGLAWASKPTAWFLAPFYLLLVAGGDARDLWRRPFAWLGRAFRAAWPGFVTAALLIGPYALWDPAALFDDVWRWSTGTSETAYQIWGWGASNLVLALGWVQSRFDYWPFWLPELVVGLPLLIGLIKQQAGDNSPARAMWNYGLFLLAFFFVSRFLNENYLGYILAFLALGTLTAFPSGAGSDQLAADTIRAAG